MNTGSTSPSNPVVTLLTDFGLRDGFVGVMKGVILSRIPHAAIVDISHEIEPFDIASAFLLDWAFRYFPEGSVHTVVVDPGVGTQRKVLALETERYRFLCPDNGVISYIWARPWKVRRLVCAENRSLWLDEVSSTFHGRDIFAPLAAFLVGGGSITHIGPTITRPAVLLATPRLQFSHSKVEGEVCYIDRFGNLVTSIDRASLFAWLQGHSLAPDQVFVTIRTTTIAGISTSYAAVPEGEPVAVFDGYNRLEIAFNMRRADKILGASIGDHVTVSIRQQA